MDRLAVSLKVSELVPLLFAQRCFAGQNFAKCPVNAVNRVRNHAIHLLIFGIVQRKREGAERIADVVVHLRDDLHPGYHQPVPLSYDLYQLCRKQGDDQRRKTFGYEPFSGAPDIRDENVVHKFCGQKRNHTYRERSDNDESPRAWSCR
jgi:hypothetical protein